MVAIRKLEPRDATSLAKLEAQFHPEPLRDGEPRLRQLLETVAYERINHCFGLFDESTLVGYLLCYGPQDSELPGVTGQPAETGDEAIYIEDVAILEPYRRHFLKLFGAFAQDVIAHYPGLPAEAIGIEPLVRAWESMGKYAEKHGYRVTHVLPTQQSAHGHTRFLIRWECLQPAPDPDTRRRQALASMDEVIWNGPEGPLTVRCLRRSEQLPLMNPDWDRLVLETPGHTAFQTLAYQELWWDYFGAETGRLMVLLVFDAQDRLIGVAPLGLMPESKPNGQVWTLGFIGSRWEADRPGFLFGPRAAVCLPACLHYLQQRRSLWDKAYFYEQRDDADLQRLIQGFRQQGCLVGVLPDSQCPTIRFQGTWKEFIGAKSRKFRKNIEAAGRKLAGMGEVRYVTYTSVEDNLIALDRHRDLETRSWKAADNVGLGSDERYLPFYRDVVRAMAPSGRFVSRTLWVGEQPVANTFGLLHDGSFFSLQIVHDEAFSKASPGTYLEALELEECFAQQLKDYDFLGGFLTNKSRWTDDFLETRQVFVYPRTPYYLGLYAWYFLIKPRLKAAWRQLRPHLEHWKDRWQQRRSGMPPAANNPTTGRKANDGEEG